VAVIGLGDIARKAYLPTMAARPGVDLHLMTRSRDRLDAVADQYRVPGDRRHTDLAELVAGGLDAAFVHVPTDQHATVVGQLLDTGVPTYVDKPLDSTIEGSRALVEQSERTGTPLMVGFNRRYVPAYVQALDRPRELIVLQKHPRGEAGPARAVVYDEFIHVVDTLRFLAPGPIDTMAVTGAADGANLNRVVLTVGGSGFTAIGIMHWHSGSKEERLDISGNGTKREIHELTRIVEHHGDRAELPIDGWLSVAAQRGFEQICTAFLAAVAGTAEFPDLRDALRSHEICEHVVTELTNTAG
jgi:virulence factor